MNSSKKTKSKQSAKGQKEIVRDENSADEQEPQDFISDTVLAQYDGLSLRDIAMVLNDATDEDWRHLRDLLLAVLRPNAIKRTVINLAEAMDSDTWQENKAEIYKLLDIVEPPPLPDVLHTADGDLKIIRYKQDPLEPLSWKADQPTAFTVFGMGFEGTWHFDVPSGTRVELNYEKNFKIRTDLRMSKLEAQLRYCLGKQTRHLADYPLGTNTDTIPRNVSEADWQAALGGDAHAVRAVNKSHPSCIYYNLYIMAQIHYHTVNATLSPHPDEAFDSRDWLQTALLPFTTYSSRKGAKSTPRTEINRWHLTIFWIVFRNIEMVRAIANPADRSRIINSDRLLELLPELAVLDGETPMGADRRAWSNLVVGYTIRKDAPLEILDARQAAFKILADITGYKGRYISDRLQELHGSKLGPQLSIVRKEAKAAAAEFLLKT